MKPATEPDLDVTTSFGKATRLSTWCLRDWLESVRTDLIAGGEVIGRPIPKEGDPGQELSEWQQKIAALNLRLTHDVPPDILDRTPEQHARWLLANILGWHRREEKAVWWEYFRLRALSAEELLDERKALSGLTFVEAAGGTAKAPVHRYRFPPQEAELRSGDDLKNLGGANFGKVEAISFADRTIDIKKRQDTAALHPLAVFAHMACTRFR